MKITARTPFWAAFSRETGPTLGRRGIGDLLRRIGRSFPITRGGKYDLWLIYRQELRDLPENTADTFNPVWPIQPESTALFYTAV
jgi:hypothetical protein